jgi:hypothetical protein
MYAEAGSTARTPAIMTTTTITDVKSRNCNLSL